MRKTILAAIVAAPAAAPANGAVITAGFAFDVPARFDSDQRDITIEIHELGRRGQIGIVEIRG